MLDLIFFHLEAEACSSREYYGHSGMFPRNLATKQDSRRVYLKNKRHR